MNGAIGSAAQKDSALPLPLLIDEDYQHLGRRSSSARVISADTLRKISLVRRDLLRSRSSSLSRASSSVISQLIIVLGDQLLGSPDQPSPFS